MRWILSLVCEAEFGGWGAILRADTRTRLRREDGRWETCPCLQGVHGEVNVLPGRKRDGSWRPRELSQELGLLLSGALRAFLHGIFTWGQIQTSELLFQMSVSELSLPILPHSSEFLYYTQMGKFHEKDWKKFLYLHPLFPLSGKFRALVPHRLAWKEAFLTGTHQIHGEKWCWMGYEVIYHSAPSSSVLWELLQFWSTACLQNSYYSELVTRNTQQTGKYVRTSLPETCNLELGLHLEASEFR